MAQSGSSYALLRTDIEFYADPTSDRVLVASRDNGQQFRLSADAVKVLELLDGTRDSSQIAQELGAREGLEPEIALAIDRFVAIGLATREGSTSTPSHISHKKLGDLVRRSGVYLARMQRPGRRLRYNAPAGLEFNLGSPDALLQRVGWFGEFVSKVPVRLTLVFVTLSGVAAYFASWSSVYRDLSRPATVATTGIALAVTLVTGMLHEIAHGMALHHYGGRVRRLGLMLLYGMPAMFCDVSQAWRLRRGQRVNVALAGIQFHLLVGALAAWSALAVRGASPGASQLLNLIAALQLAMACLNLTPFVKFDGYVALAGWTDIPYLRRKSMNLAGAALGRLVFGRGELGNERAELGGWRWGLFGVVSALFGPALVVYAILSFGPIFLAFLGQVGAYIILVVIAFAAFFPIRAVVRAFSAAKFRGVHICRRASGLVVLALLLGLILGIVPVQLQESGSFQTSHGTTFLVVGQSDAPPLGTQVKLMRPGIVFRPFAGVATVCGPKQQVEVNLLGGGPVLFSSTSLSSVGAVPLSCAGPAPGEGLAVVERGETSLGGWLFAALVDPYMKRALQ